LNNKLDAPDVEQQATYYPGAVYANGTGSTLIQVIRRLITSNNRLIAPVVKEQVLEIVSIQLLSFLMEQSFMYLVILSANDGIEKQIDKDIRLPAWAACR
jgi:hypothetical protein